MHKYQHKESKKMKEQEMISQTKEQDKFLETNTNETEIYDLSDRIQNNHRKDAIRSQENKA